MQFRLFHRQSWYSPVVQFPQLWKTKLLPLHQPGRRFIPFSAIPWGNKSPPTNERALTVSSFSRINIRQILIDSCKDSLRFRLIPFRNREFQIVTPVSTAAATGTPRICAHQIRFSIVFLNRKIWEFVVKIAHWFSFLESHIHHSSLGWGVGSISLFALFSSSNFRFQGFYLWRLPHRFQNLSYLLLLWWPAAELPAFWLPSVLLAQGIFLKEISQGNCRLSYQDSSSIGRVLSAFSQLFTFPKRNLPLLWPSYQSSSQLLYPATGQQLLSLSSAQPNGYRKGL